jgi:hypothetical protein
MQIPTPKSQAPNPTRLLALGVGIWALAFGISISAQSPYVAATIGADVPRVSHTDSSLYSSPSNDAEVVSGSLRVGTSLGEAWGVELEFVRSGRSHRSQNPFISPLAGGVNIGSVTSILSGGASPVGIPISSPVNFQTDVRSSHSDLDAVLWARQRLGGSIDMVYLGGLVFSRERVDVTQTFPTVIRTLAPSGGFRTTLIDYGTRPLVGVESRIRMTSHMRLMPGLRLQGLGDGWLLRPYVGLGWFF